MERLDSARQQHDDLLRQHAAGIAFDRASQWRLERIDTLQNELDLYWANAVLDAARDGHPIAYGKQRLQAARHTLIEQIETIETGADRPAPGHPYRAGLQIEDPLRDLADLDRSIQQAAERPEVQFVEPAKPRRQHRMDPWPNIHEQHIAYQHLHQSDGPSVGVRL